MKIAGRESARKWTDAGSTALALPPREKPHASLSPNAADQRSPIAPESARHVGRRAVLGGAAWTVAGFGTNLALRFGFNLILTRLLLPEVFGLMVLVNTFLAGLQFLSEIGIGPSLIQHQRGEEPAYYNTAWTLQLGRGLLLWLCACLLAWPVALFYGNPLLISVIPAVGATVAISGLNSTALHILSRRILRARLVLLQVGCYFVGMLAAVAWILWFRRDVWGLVAGSLMTSMLLMVLSHLVLPGHRNRLAWDRVAAHQLFHFGKWIFLSTLCAFLADQIDGLVVGKVTSLATLGVYQIAAQLAIMPVVLIRTLSMQIVFPLYSRSLDRPAGIQGTVTQVHPALLIGGAMCIAALIGTGPSLVKCLYPPKYHEAGWMAQLIAVAAWFKMLESAGSSILWGRGQSRAPALNNAIKVAVLVVGLPIGFHFGGLAGLILAIISADVVRYLVTVQAIHGEGLHVLRYDVPATLAIAATSAAALLTGVSLGSQASPRIRLLTEGSVIALLWFGILLWAWRHRILPRPRHLLR
jgi:O-antigen/teichoic acid export membrane protein